MHGSSPASWPPLGRCRWSWPRGSLNCATGRRSAPSRPTEGPMTTDNLMTRRGLLAGAGATAVLAAGRAAAGETRPDDDLTRLSIAEASRRIATRELSPVEL